MQLGAHFDSTGTYRYSLWRIWDSEKPRVLFIMLNPSTADSERDDPTIRRCIGFARSWGFGSVEAVNLFAYRASRPQALFQAPEPVGPENDRWLQAAVGRAGVTLAGWGNWGRRLDRDREVLSLLGRGSLHCLGMTRAGEPRHPLYVRRGVLPLKFNPQATLPR